MSSAVVIGAGVGGLAAALSLAQRGLEVTLVERDTTPMPEDPDSAFRWDRRGAPQVRHSHAFLARLRNLLRDHHPGVLAALLEAGASEIRFCEMLPAEIEDRDSRPGDEDLVALACRRTTFEWVLRQEVLGFDGVRLADGAAAAGLRAERGRSPGAPPRITGVRLDGGEVCGADIVIAAGGRRAPVPEWLAEHGATTDEITEETGIVYLSRFYCLGEGRQKPDQAGPIGGDLGYLKYAVFEGDNRTFSVTLAALAPDVELRKMLRDPPVFDLAARALPATAPWVERAVPITGVYVMAGLQNRLRRFTRSGEPVVAGFHALGDAHTLTNPLYGRGCTLAAVQASLLASALDAHPDDPLERARRYEEACAREVEPWYHAAVASDSGHAGGPSTTCQGALRCPTTPCC